MSGIGKFSGLLLALWLGAGSFAVSAEDEVAIKAETVAARTRTLASDAFGGRPPSGPMAEKTVQYLAGFLKKAGLEPAFGDSYLQEVPLVSLTADPAARLAVRTAGGVFEYTYAEDMMIWTTRVVERAALKDSELVFVGYGINAPEFGWNDYAGVDMTGKTAVILVNDPGFATQDPDLFSGNKMTYYGRWTYKYEEAARQGAAGAIIIHETAPASYGWDVVKNSWSGPQFDLQRPDNNMSRVAIEGWVQKYVAEEIFTAAGLDYEALKEAATRKGFRAVPMTVTASVEARNKIARSRTYNVAGVVRGTARPDETIIYTAHWDHWGVGPAVDGDNIYNGAIDNAVGVVGLMEIAEKFAYTDRKPRRSVTFLFVSAEEQGLLGAYHYAENPAFPLNKTVGLLNTDVMQPIGAMEDMVVVGRHSSELEEILEAVVAEQGRRLTPYPNPESGFYFRSDHFALAKKGVPALYLHTGTTHVEKGREFVTSAKARYNAEIYHTPFDEYSESWDWAGVVLDLEAMYRVGRTLVDGNKWPRWYPGIPFKSAREKSLPDQR